MSTNLRWEKWSIAALAALAMASCLLMPFLSLLKNTYFAYMNGWDESTYLSYQGAVTLLTKPNYAFAALLIWLLHHLGVSGAWQNFVSDLLVSPLIFFLVVKIFQRLGVDTYRALIGAFLLMVGNLFLNHFSPLIRWLDTLGWPWLLTAQGYYLMVFRTPNPQWSFLLVALFVWLYLKYQRVYLLWLPVPLLYLPVVMPYLYLLLIYMAWRRWPRLGHWKVAGMCLALLLLMCLGIKVAFGAYVNLYPSVKVLRIVSRTVGLLVTPSLLVGVVAALAHVLCVRGGLLEEKLADRWVHISLLGVLLLLINQQVISGYRMEPHNFEVYVNPLLALGMWLYLLERTTRRWRGRVWLKAACLLMAVLLCATVWSANGFQFDQGRFRIFIYPYVASEDVARLRKDPLHAIVPLPWLASRMAMAFPRLLAPPFSYHYIFLPVALSCEKYQQINEAAWRFVERHRHQQPALAKNFPALQRRYQWRRRTLDSLRKELGLIPYQQRLCPPGNVDLEGFFLVIPQGSSQKIYLP